MTKKTLTRGITIPDGRFCLYQEVTLYWNSKSYPTKIVRRLYNPDKDEWLYEVAGSPSLYGSDPIEPR